MWHVALESWQWIHQVAAPCVTRGSGMTCHWIPPNVHHIGILHLVSISTTSPQSTCHSAPVSKILSKSDHPRQKTMTSCRFSRWRISAILDFRGPIMGALKSPYTTSYRSSIETMALNCLVSEKIAFCILATDKQTNKQTDEQMDSTDALSHSRCQIRDPSSRQAQLHSSFLLQCRRYCSLLRKQPPSSVSLVYFLSASLYVSKRGAYWDRLCRDVVGWLVGRWSSRACTVAKRCILGL